MPSIDLVKKYQSNKKDTGSADVQVVLLTEKIADLARHLKKHAKDSDSRRGLLIMVGKRRRLLNYLRKGEPKTYDKLIKDLGLKK
jgi:small subunit ribosomal protein S15